jgi:pyridoxal phosphate enzyme (YggS family)
MGIAEKYNEIRARVDEAAVRSGRDPSEVTLMAVTKTRTADEINRAIDAGATDVGENKVQEVVAKYGDVKDVRLHFIGHLQTNKVKTIIDKVVMIHSVDSMHLAKEIDKRAKAAGLTMDILIEINPAMEETKSGVSTDEAAGLAASIAEECENLRIRGVMCIPPPAETPEDARPYFRETKEVFDELKAADLPGAKIDTLSMGMSGDFEVAIEEGSTIVRVGTSIFGPRNYNR